MGAGVTRQRECPGSRGGEATGKDPTNRGKLGTKRHVVVDRQGVPLAVTISGANVHDSKLLEKAVVRSRRSVCPTGGEADHDVVR